METNNVQPVNFGNSERRRGPSVIGSTITNAAIGAVAGGALGFFGGVREKSFVEEGGALLKKINKEKTETELTNLFKAAKTDAGRKEVMGLIKKARVISGLKMGAIMCGTMGLIFGIINKVRYNKAAHSAE